MKAWIYNKHGKFIWEHWPEWSEDSGEEEKGELIYNVIGVCAS